jgi:hypothetical protein
MSFLVNDVLADPEKYIGKHIDIQGLLLGPSFRLCGKGDLEIKMLCDKDLEKEIISKLPNFVGGRALINSPCNISCKLIRLEGSVCIDEITKIVTSSKSGGDTIIVYSEGQVG